MPNSIEDSATRTRVVMTTPVITNALYHSLVRSGEELASLPPVVSLRVGAGCSFFCVAWCDWLAIVLRLVSVQARRLFVSVSELAQATLSYCVCTS